MTKQERSRLYYLKNRETILKKVKKYVKNNPDIVLETKRKVRRSLYGRLAAIFNAQIQRSKKNKNHKKLHSVHYDKEYFINRFINDNKYIDLHKKWVQSNYDKKLTPSIDRINHLKEYEKDNIQMITWIENIEKAKKEGRTSKKVTMSKNGIRIKIFNSVTEASNETGVLKCNISLCAIKMRGSAGGYNWSYII